MHPQRMCMVCRERKGKKDFIRLVCTKGGKPYIDFTGTGEGRGMYICRGESCIAQARKRRVIERAFSCKADEAVYDELEQMAQK